MKMCKEHLWFNIFAIFPLLFPQTVTEGNPDPSEAGGGGNFNIKKTGVLVENLEKNWPDRYQDPVFWAWLLSVCFWLSTLKGTLKAPTEVEHPS